MVWLPWPVSAFGAGAASAEGIAGAPAPFDKGGVKVALISYISAGDFFQAYQAGAEAQAKALGIDLRIFPGRQDAAEEREQVQQAINLGVQGIIIDHGLPESLKDVAQTGARRRRQGRRLRRQSRKSQDSADRAERP